MGTYEKEFPLHWHVWHNNVGELAKELNKNEFDVNLDALDPRGRTALHLAVTLGHLESARLLLQANADVNIENKDGWTVVQEAISTGDPELVQLVLQHRDHQRAASRIGGIPALLEKLRQTSDFYVEMKWEFTSWVPFMSRLCPHDTYKVYKSGPNVRIDTTLIGFDNMNWIRGNRSFIFKNTEANRFQFMEVDHDNKVVYSELMEIQPHHDLSRMRPSENAVAARLTSPVVNTYIDTDKIEFSRTKAGFWGWRHDKLEEVNGYECKVFSASNVQLVTKTRTEHLTKEDKERNKADGSPFTSPLQSLLGVAEQHQQEGSGEEQTAVEHGTPTNPSDIKPEEYFNIHIPLGQKDIGRPKEVSTKLQKFRATLWLSEDYPLSLQEQVMPIIDLMAISNAHFQKLRDFITLQLPAGFPVRIGVEFLTKLMDFPQSKEYKLVELLQTLVILILKIPLFHILNACITFGNHNCKDSPTPGVSSISMEDLSAQKVNTAPTNGVLPETDAASAATNPASLKTKTQPTCVVDHSVFDIPEGYLHNQAGQNRVRYRDDELLQMAILRSQLEQQGDGSIDDFVLSGQDFLTEDQMLERAIQESLLVSATSNGTIPNQTPSQTDQSPTVQDRPLPEVPPQLGSPMDEQLRLALELSERELKEAERLRKEEEEELQRILQLSMDEK